MFFTPEQSAANAERYAILCETAAVEQAFYEYLDRRMREAGFVRLEEEALAWSKLADEDHNGLCYSRDGLIASYTGSSWRILARATGELLTELPEEVGVVARFAFQAEQILWQTSWPPADPLLGTRLRQIARECVEDELRQCRALQARLERWLHKHKGTDASPLLSLTDPQ
jgi:hypothetical protein